MSRSAGVHFLLAAVPEVEQSVVLVGAEVGEVSEQAVGEPLVPQHARPPGLGQHGVVGPVVSDLLFAAKRPLAVGCGGVSAAALLPAGVLPLGVRQLQEHGAWQKRSTLKRVHFQTTEKAADVFARGAATNLLRGYTGVCSPRGN